MSVKVQVSKEIDRSVDKVFDFVATNHVQNHPRWDPDMELEQVTDGPIGVGTILRRRHTHSETPVEGTMEIVEFEPNRAMGTVIHDGSVEVRSRMMLESLSENKTSITISAEFIGMYVSLDEEIMTSMIGRSLTNMKQLIETEL